MPAPTTGSLGQFRRGTWADRQLIATVPFSGEPLFDSDFDFYGRRCYTGDGGEAAGILTGWHSSPHPGQKADWYYSEAVVFTAFVTAAISANFILYKPIYLGGNNVSGLANIDALTIEVTTGVNGPGVRIALYSSNEYTGEPDELITESGSLSTKSAAIHTYNPTDILVPSGWYWTAVVTDSAAVGFRAVDNLASGTNFGTAASNYLQNNAYYEAHTFGAFPANATVAGAVHGDYAAVRVKA